MTFQSEVKKKSFVTVSNRIDSMVIAQRTVRFIIIIIVMNITSERAHFSFISNKVSDQQTYFKATKQPMFSLI